MGNNGFRLLAIRPLEGCDAKFMKKLQGGSIYKFYQDSTFLVKNADGELKEITKKEEKSGAQVDSIKYNSSLPDDLYSKGDLKIHVSAVVGKNGSGKSTLLELLYATVYNLSVKYEILTLGVGVNADRKLEGLSSLYVEVYYSINENIYCLRSQQGKSLALEIVEYKDGGSLRVFKIGKVLEDKKMILAKYFFYSIAINYSLYGLNSEHNGTWLKSLFHKNDGYQTPVVINPFREKGNIDINIELYLAKQRLISNLLKPIKEDNSYNFRLITDSQSVYEITFSLNLDKTKYAFKTGPKEGDEVMFDTFFKASGEDKKDRIQAFYDVFSKGETINETVKFKAEVELYILKKLINIARTYREYTGHFRDSLIISQGEHNGTKSDVTRYTEHFIDFEKYLNKLKVDHSHLTFKLRQALNYLKNDTLGERLKGIAKWRQLKIKGEERKTLTVSVESLSEVINDFVDEQSEIVKNIPPSLFDIELYLKSEQGEKSVFSELSSGEQQLIHSIQSIMYHALNVDSVFNGLPEDQWQEPDEGDEKNKKTKKVRYGYLNVILDEVELYFHPEFQRTFVYELVKGLRRLELENIHDINILFSTHSPFILSDIPASNVLKLSEGQVDTSPEIESFGANIHYLLKDSFFMEKGLIGEYARKVIQLIIDFLKQKESVDAEISEENKKILSSWKPTNEEVLNYISLIGEPIVKQNLLTRFYRVTSFEQEEEGLISKMIAELSEIKKG